MTLTRQDNSLMVVMEQPSRQELRSQFVELRAKSWCYIRIARKLQVSEDRP
jgi:hypothetical protein